MKESTSTGIPAVRSPGERTFRFGPDASLTATITEPTAAPCGAGAIIWGMGVAEIRNARALARHGITTMQIHQDPGEGSPEYWPLLDSTGVQRCQVAMDELAARRGVQRFVLKGSCGTASLCFNTALADERVTGLVLANPHVNEMLTVGEGYRRRLLSARTWRKILTGQINFARHLYNLKWIGQGVAARLRGEADEVRATRFSLTRDVTLPADLLPQLERLLQRQVQTLIVFSDNDDALFYFQKHFGESFEKLQGLPGLTIERVPTEQHVIARDDAAASVMRDTIHRWAQCLTA